MLGIRVNSKTVIASLTLVIVCIYLLYSWISVRSAKSGTYHRRLDTWKKHDFVDIPQGTKKMAQNVKVNEDTVKVLMDNKVIEKVWAQTKFRGP